MTKQIDNFFTEQEIIDIYGMFIHTERCPEPFYIAESTGRKIINAYDLMYIPEAPLKNVFDKIVNTANKEYGLDLKVFSFGLHYYSSIFGTPQLLPHIDEDAGQVVFDYQLKSNIDWPIYIEGEEFTLKDNSALMFEGEKYGHWRSEKSFNDRDFVIVFIVNLIDNNHWRNFSETNPRSRDEIMKIIEQKRKDFRPNDHR